MAVRALKVIAIALALIVAGGPPAAACFGPKLYLGTGPDPRQELLFALVSLYVAEKTGVESERVSLAADELPAAALAEERVDLVFADGHLPSGTTLLAVSGYPLLVSGTRPLTDLQFTTVAPALRKLEALLTPADLAALEARVAGGEKPLAAARHLLRERRWL